MGIYFDNAATSFPKPDFVIKAMNDYFANIGANASRASYQRARNASRLVFETRETVASLIHAQDSSRVIFTQNATESLNLAILGFGLKKGDHVITSSIEHNSVMRPLRFLETNKKIVIDIVKCNSNGQLYPGDLESTISEYTKLIVINHASNVVGTILPIKEIGKIARKYNIPFLVDAAQTIGCIPVDIEQNNIDLLAFSGHKGLLGPQGIGCLYIKKNIEIAPLKYGGTGSRSESEIQPDFLPDKYESGTMNLAGIAGLSAGIDFILKKGIKNIKELLQNLTGLLLEELSGINGITIYGARDKTLQTSVVSINIDHQEPSQVCDILDREYDIAARVGLHCSPQCHKTIGTFPRGTLRISPGLHNDSNQIKILCEALCKIAG